MYKIHPSISDRKGRGKWDMDTTRYIPFQGGSRSRLPVADDTHIPRYEGGVGVDDRLSHEVGPRISGLYHKIGGAPTLSEDALGRYIRSRLELSMAWIKALQEKAEIDDEAEESEARDENRVGRSVAALRSS